VGWSGVGGREKRRSRGCSTASAQTGVLHDACEWKEMSGEGEGHDPCSCGDGQAICQEIPRPTAYLKVCSRLSAAVLAHSSTILTLHCAVSEGGVGFAACSIVPLRRP
jgi:hypothetical protein